MPDYVEPVTTPPPVAANVNARWYTTCVHHHVTPHPPHTCDLGHQADLFDLPPCSGCGRFSRRDPA